MAVNYPQGHVFYRNLYRTFPVITHGKGVYLYDSDGGRYLDASGGAAVVNIGHGIAEISGSLSSQAYKVGYVNGTQFSHQPVEDLAERIAEFLPFSDGKIFFLTSGSEAIEASIKLARQYWVEQGQKEKFYVLSRNPSYHGNTLAALSLSAREHYKYIYQPMLMKSSMIPAPYCYRCFCQEIFPSCNSKCAHELEKRILKLGKENVSAFITEVIGGSSTGVTVPPPEYFSTIRKICDEYEILLIVDEVMTGIGRTGKWLASHHFNLKPDIVVLGKGLTSGYFPLSAVATTKEIVDVLYDNGRNFLHSQTFAHHPVGCAAGLATLDYIRDHDLLKKSRENGSVLLSELSALLSHPHVGDVRGRGLLAAVEFVSDKKDKTPFPRELKYVEKFFQRALKNGIVIWPNVGHADGVNGDLVLVAPPFTISMQEISRIRRLLEDTLAEMDTIL
ncbi:MAG: aspartate aminotransferase family protein [Candidatus Aminicenantes bacterium]|nr:aspartate aminotransferase family protein [Candidatus Aminicenantes bacterium]